MIPGSECPLRSLGRELAFDSSTDALSAAAERIAALHPRVKTAELFARMSSPGAHHANLRGKLLLMEIACPDLAVPHAFYLMRTSAELLWHGAPIRLFLFGLYRPEAIRPYLLASGQVFQERLTAENIGAWLDGHGWPEEAR